MANSAHYNFTVAQSLDQIMERASQALVSLDYLTCEGLCLQALAEARSQQRWSYYARILLPLQEARRQRRMIATDQGARLIDSAQPEPTFDAGCLVLTHPHTTQAARTWRDRERAERRCVEVLYVDNAPDAARWTIRSYAGPEVIATVDAPPTPTGGPRGGGLDVGWFLQAGETLGDAAITQVNHRPEAQPGAIERVRRLEQMLDVVDDHEKLHQRLSDAALAVA